MQIDDLDAIPPGVAKIAAKTGDELKAIFIYEFVSHFGQLRLIANHDAKVSVPQFTTRSLVFEHRQELMFAQFKERIALPFVQLLQFKDINIKCDCGLDIAYLDRDMIAAIHLDAHS